jgi:peptidyl-prolyl cis-trans isomerase SurA
MHCDRCAILAALVAVSLVPACRSASSPAPAAVPADTWAVVDGRPITRDRVEKEYRRVRQGAQAMSDQEALLAKLSVLEDLIVEEILFAKAPSLKIEVSDSELDAAYAEAQKKVPNQEAFQQELTRRNLTMADLRDGLRREILGRKILEQEVASKITVTDQEVTDFFNANRSQFNVPEEAYHLAQIIVTPFREPQIANRAGDDAGTPQEAAAKVSMLMERLKAGAPFADLARDYSEDPETAPRGGDLGLVPVSRIKQAPAPLREATLGTKVGAARVVSEGGSHTIVYVVSHEQAGQRDLSTPGVKERITDGLKAGREELVRAAYLAAARTDAEVVNYLARRVVENQGKSLAP